MVGSPSSLGSGALLVALLGTGCASVPSLLRQGRWSEACEVANAGGDRHAFAQALGAAIAPDLRIELHVFDRAELSRELGVPVEGELLDHVVIARFFGTLSSSKLTATALTLEGMSDGTTVWATDRVQMPSEEEQFFFTHNGGLTDSGLTELFVSSAGKPGYPDAVASSFFDGVPLPLGGGVTIGDLRQRSRDEAASAAAYERRLWREREWRAIQGSPVRLAAAERVRSALAEREWILLRLGVMIPTEGVTVSIDGVVGGDGAAKCTTWLAVVVDPPAPGGLTAYNALFPDGPRALASLPHWVRP